MRLIDADALTEAFYNRKRTLDDMEYLRVPAELVYEFIHNSPTVIVDIYSMGYQDGVRTVLKEVADGKHRPQGEWIYTDNRWGLGDWECNKCHKYSNKDTNFCPNCGADMRGKEDDQNTNTNPV